MEVPETIANEIINDSDLLGQILNRLDIISAILLLLFAGIIFYKIGQFLYKLF